MRPTPIRVTVLRLMLAVAILAIGLSFFTESRSRHVEDCLRIADNHARLGAEYRRNAYRCDAKGNPTMLLFADWHEFMVRQFERAANRPWSPRPATSPFPPTGWVPPKEVASVR